MNVRVLLFILANMACALVAGAEAGPTPIPDFAPGQEWTIKSQSPTGAKVIIGRVEPWGGKIVVHVTVIDIPIPAGMPGAGETTAVGHMPFDKMALAASVDKLLAIGVAPDPSFERAYEQWHSDKSAGVFTISVEKAIEIMFQTIDRRQG